MGHHLIIIAIVFGTFIYRRKNREIKYLKRVHQANMDRRVPGGKHYKYNPEGEYYGDDRLTYYTVISIVFSLRVGTPPLALSLQGVSQVMRNMDRTGILLHDTSVKYFCWPIFVLIILIIF